MAKKTYWELLKDPRWQRRRLEILEREDFACENCGSKDKTLHVHHKIYRKGAMPWDYADRDLMSLCEDCHEAETHVKRRLDEALSALGTLYYEQVLGYLEALRVLEAWGDCRQDDLPMLTPSSAEFVSGLADGLRLDFFGQEIDENLCRDLPPRELIELHAEHVQQRRLRRMGGD